MHPKTRHLLFALLLLCPPGAYSQLPWKRRMPRPTHYTGEGVSKIEPQTREDILKVAAQPAPKEGILARLLNTITINTSNGPIIPFPVVDSSKDLGPSYGFMPVVALRGKKSGELKSVIVPSVMYNENLRTTLTYRHYIFPDEKRYFILRASRSERVERELMAYYYTPQLFSTSMRFSVEAKHWITGKPSFYGYGINSKKANKANYALQMTGEEVILDLPLIKHLFLNFNHTYFDKRIGPGPVTNGQLKELFPADYSRASEMRTFHANRFSLVYDDTDHPFLPKIGTFASASAQYSNRKLGSDYEYRTYAFQVKNYYNYKEEGRYVTAVHYLLQFQRGQDLPFYAMPQLGESTGLRMAGDGRFTDRGKFVFTIEERITMSRTPFMKFISETEIAPFLDVGTVFAKPTDFSARNLKYAPGVSARLVIRPQMVATVDLAYGSEGTNAIIRVGYPF
ncbi:MAG TPA: BamA/TamA family outer membrane protein [Elusimicrobiales bacterium]|nr:BamA/TamA family outer membrane protein [Elusimicrobiales bacterium]